ncbi:unnamed protein product, partial [Didymodactylos carnosus]
EEARKRAKKNDSSYNQIKIINRFLFFYFKVKHMVFNRVSSVVIYYSHSRVSEYPLHHVGYLDRDLLFVVSTVCALLGNGPDKGDFIVRAAVSDVRHNRNHDQLGQFYVTIRQ